MGRRTDRATRAPEPVAPAAPALGHQPGQPGPCPRLADAESRRSDRRGARRERRGTGRRVGPGNRHGTWGRVGAHGRHDPRFGSWARREPVIHRVRVVAPRRRLARPSPPRPSPGPRLPRARQPRRPQRRRSSTSSGGTSSRWQRPASSVRSSGARASWTGSWRCCAGRQAQPGAARPGRVGQDRDRRGPGPADRAGRVPPPLQGVRIVEVPLGSLVAGTEYRGQLEERLDQLVREASQPGIILFFDEIHLLAGAGGSQGGIAADEVLKPALGRGDIAVIGATTDEEYRATIGRDAALARRFTTVAISELDRKATLPILRRSAIRSRRSAGSGSPMARWTSSSSSPTRGSRTAASRTRRSTSSSRRSPRPWWPAGLGSTARLPSSHDRGVGGTGQLDADPRAVRAGSRRPREGRPAGTDRRARARDRHDRPDPAPALEAQSPAARAAGAGKTAIVEGFAIRSASGAHPDALEGTGIRRRAARPGRGRGQRDPTLLAEFLLEARHPSVVCSSTRSTS